MAVQPIYLIRDKPAGPFYHGDVIATHVAFAIDDLPKLAAAILDTYNGTRAAVLDCLRGITANSGAVDDGPVQH